MALDPALAVLARAKADQDTSLEPLAAAAHGFTSGGVLLISVVVAHDRAELANLASVREPGSAAMALVIDRDAYRSERSGDGPSEDARRHTEVLTQSGWQTVIVGPEDSVPGAWQRLRAARRTEVLT